MYGSGVDKYVNENSFPCTRKVQTLSVVIFAFMKDNRLKIKMMKITMEETKYIFHYNNKYEKLKYCLKGRWEYFLKTYYPSN